MHWARWRKHGDPLVTAWNKPKPPCSVGGCGRTGKLVRGWCNLHYQRWRRTGDPLLITVEPPQHWDNEICNATEDCAKPAKTRGWCSMHYARWQKHKSFGKPERPKKIPLICKIEDCGLTVECRGWCNKHYMRWRIHGDPMVCSVSDIIETCSQRGCGRRLVKGGVCWTHYRYFKAKFMVEQEGRCAICGIHANDAPRKILHLDHDHATNQPRALLCHNCNVGIGHFFDNPELLRIAARYVEEMKPGQLALFAA